MNPNNLYFSVTEASRLTGIDKKGIYNRCGGSDNRIVLVDNVRKGRKFAEAVIPFEGIVAMRPEFEHDFGMSIIRLFSIPQHGMAFRVNELTRILGLSNQWIQKQIKEGKIKITKNRFGRYGRTKTESLIHWTELRHLKDISFEQLQERVLELFELSWRFTEKNAYHSCRLGIGEFRVGQENGKFICPNCLAQRNC